MALTSGNHAPIAIAAAHAGVHVFTEKPMALSVADGQAMVEAAEQAGVCLMVGTMKRYDPAYERLAELLADVRDDLRLVRVTTLESPLRAVRCAYPLLPPSPAPAALIAELRKADELTVDSVLGDADEVTRFGYRWLLPDNLVTSSTRSAACRGAHRGVYASLARESVAANLRFGEAPCHLSWVDLMPGIARYKQEFAFYPQEQRLTLEFPSPYLRNQPSRLFVEAARTVPHTAGPARRPFPRRAFRRDSTSSPTASQRDARRGRPATTALPTSGCVRRWRASTSGWTRTSPSRRPPPSRQRLDRPSGRSDRFRPDAHRPGRRRAHGTGAPRPRSRASDDITLVAVVEPLAATRERLQAEGLVVYESVQELLDSRPRMAC